jgi:ferritin-like metal-binding protein YciE
MSTDDRMRDLFVTGLKNAHAMESQALAIMRPQVGRLKHYPEITAKLEEHIGETEGQIARIETVLDTCRADKSTLKDAALSLAGTMAALGHVPAADEILKNSFANYAFENYEAAAYKSLMTLARRVHADDAVDLLQISLDEELAMAGWLADNVERVTDLYADRVEADVTAKR